jgi:triosephosphate isomerase (TIM)
MTAVIVAGNWKMNLGPRETEAFLDHYLAGQASEGLGEPHPGVRVVLFPPALSLDAARAHLTGALGASDRWPLALGVQQLHPEASGAFTGENAAEHAVEAGATFALVGHSERRTLFHETDNQVARRADAALRARLTPVLCVGETLEERRAGRLKAVLSRQLDAVLGPPALRERLRANGFVVAYEPVWAIGTGETATPDDAADAHALIRGRLRERLGGEGGGEVPILYGGSVNPQNAAELLAAPEVGGVLVGGASLDPDSFAALVAHARQAVDRR